MLKDTAKARLKSVALPTEHGGWGFLLEPIVLGFLVAASPGGLWLTLAALGVFLMHHPLSLAVRDQLRGRRYARTRLAGQVAAAYGAMAASGFGLALATSSLLVALPILVAAPFAVIQMAYALTNRRRALVAEFSGAVALGAIAPAMALAGGWALGAVPVLWLLLALRAVVSILYVRARLRLARGEAAPVYPALLAHGAGLLLLGALALAGLAPWSAAAAMGVLLARAVYGLAPGQQAVRPQTVGFQEMGYGLLFVVLAAVGY